MLIHADKLPNYQGYGECTQWAICYTWSLSDRSANIVQTLLRMATPTLLFVSLSITP